MAASPSLGKEPHKRPPLTSVSPVGSVFPQKKVIGIAGDYTEDWSSFFDLPGNATQALKPELELGPKQNLLGLVRCTSDETATWSLASDEAEEVASLKSTTVTTSINIEEEEEEQLNWEISSVEEGREKFEAQLEGLRGILTGGLESGCDPGGYCKWSLLLQAEEQAKAEVVVVIRYPKPTALFSLRTEDGKRFLQETVLEAWLKNLLRKEPWPERARASRKARRAKAFSAEWSWTQVQFCLSLFLARQFSCCLDSCMRYCRVLGGVSQTIGYSLRTVNNTKRLGFDSWMTPEAHNQWQQILRASIVVLDIGVRALVQACCLDSKVDGKKSRTVRARDVPYVFRGMVEKLKTWTGPVCDTLPLLTVEEAKGIAHHFASISGLLAAQGTHHFAWPWEFAPPASISESYSRESRLIEMVVAQLCSVFTKLEKEESSGDNTASNIDHVTLDATVESLCSLELLLSARSPITGSKSPLLTDGLDMLQVDLEAFVRRNTEQVEEIQGLVGEDVNASASVCLASVIARRPRTKEAEELAWLELSDFSGSVRMHKLKGLYDNIPISFMKAKAAFTLALFALEVESEMNAAEELLFESLFVLDKLEDEERRARKFQEFTTNALKAYGDTLVANGKYKYALRAFKTAAEAFEKMEKESDLSLTRKLCNMCEIHCDWPHAMFYHVELLRATSLETQLSEFVLISESVAAICLKHQGDFTQAEAHLRMALSFLQNPKADQSQSKTLSLRLRRRLADVLLAANRVEDATDLLLDALQLQPGVRSEEYKNLERQGILMTLAKCALKLRRLDRCQSNLTMVLNEAGISRKGLSIDELLERVLHSAVCGYSFVILSSRYCLYQGKVQEALQWVDTFLGIDPGSPTSELCIQPVLALTMGQIGRLLYYRGKMLQPIVSPVNSLLPSEASVSDLSDDAAKTSTEACLSSLWMALDSFEAVGDRMWQVNVLSSIVQVDLSERWKGRTLESCSTNLDSIANAATQSITLCSNLANAPQMVNCLINMAALRNFQQQPSQSLECFSEAVALFDTLYYGGAKRCQPALKFSAGMTRRVVALLARLVRIAFALGYNGLEVNNAVLLRMVDRWSYLTERICVQHACIDKVTSASMEEIAPANTKDRQGKTDGKSGGLSAVNRLSMSRYNQGGVDSMTRRGCLYRFKMLAYGEKCLLEAEEVKRQGLEVLMKLIRLQNNLGVNEVVDPTHTNGAKLLQYDNHIYAYGFSGSKQQRFELHCNGHDLTFEQFKQLYRFCLNTYPACAKPEPSTGMGKLLTSIGVQSLVRLVEVVLAEKPIVVVCNDLLEREAIVAGLRGWLLPVKWQLLSLCSLPASFSQRFGYHLTKMDIGYVIGMHEVAIVEFIQGVSAAKQAWDELTVVHFDQGTVSFGNNIDDVVSLPLPVERILNALLHETTSEEQRGEIVCTALQRLLLWTFRPVLLYHESRVRQEFGSDTSSDVYIEELVQHEWIVENADFLRGLTGTQLLQGCLNSYAQIVHEKVRSILREKAHVYRSVSSTELSISAFVSVSSSSTSPTTPLLRHRHRKKSKLKKRWLSLNKGELVWYKSEHKRKKKGSLQLRSSTCFKIEVPDRCIAQECFGLTQEDFKSFQSSGLKVHEKYKDDSITVYYRGEDGTDNVMELKFENDASLHTWAAALNASRLKPSLLANVLGCCG